MGHGDTVTDQRKRNAGNHALGSGKGLQHPGSQLSGVEFFLGADNN